MPGTLTAHDMSWLRLRREVTGGDREVSYAFGSDSFVKCFFTNLTGHRVHYADGRPGSRCLDENRRDDPMAARYRAIRIRVQTRMSEMFGDAAPAPAAPVQQPIKAFAPPPAPVAPPKPVMTPEVLKEKAFAAMKKDNRAWSSRDLADHVAFHFKDDFQLPEEIAQKMSAMMFAEHHAGRVAACAIRRERDQVQPSALYYALTTDTLIDLLENYEVDGE